MKKKELEDIILIRNILEGDKKSEKILYDKYKEILINYLNQKFPYILDYDDNVSEILIKIFLSLSKYNSKKSKFKTWVFSIAKNYMIDKLRCSTFVNNSANTFTISNTNSQICNNTTYIDNISNINTTTTTTRNSGYDFENSISINEISNQLNTCDFAFLNMHYSYGYSYNEIGAEFNISSVTVSNRVNYIKNKLKNNKIFEDFFE